MKILFTIRIEDCGGYYQVYRKDENCDNKLGNVYPPGYELFGEVQDPDNFVADDGLYGKTKWQNLNRALAYLISPRGMT